MPDESDISKKKTTILPSWVSILLDAVTPKSIKCYLGNDGQVLCWAEAGNIGREEILEEEQHLTHLQPGHDQDGLGALQNAIVRYHDKMIMRGGRGFSKSGRLLFERELILAFSLLLRP